MTRITELLKQFISEKIPQKVTNILYQIVNGIYASLTMLEYRLDIFERERNILTAQNLSSLRNLAAQNGVEPTLRIPASGVLTMQISPKVFNKYGYPLFIKPYTVFTNTLTKLDYYYIGDKVLRLDSNNYYIPVVEGVLKTTQAYGTDEYIQSVYINETKISDKSISVEVDGVNFTEVKSFYDKIGLYDNKQFLIKWSNNTQSPIIIYILGTKINDVINITYRLTNGESGNLETRQEFETEGIVDVFGEEIVPNSDEITIFNSSGFSYGSNGSDENSLRSAIGFNHGIDLLFDEVSYKNFIAKFSTILLQKINIIDKQINNLYIWKKKSIQNIGNAYNLVNEYKLIILNKKYLLSSNEKQELSNILNKQEFALSSHNIFDVNTCKFAFQIEFENLDQKETYKELLEVLIYEEFSKFLYIKNHFIDVPNLFDTFMNNYGIIFDYIIFNEIDEQNKLINKISTQTDKIIYHSEYLPILDTNFNIADTNYDSYNINFVLNFVTKI